MKIKSQTSGYRPFLSFCFPSPSNLAEPPFFPSNKTIQCATNPFIKWRSLLPASVLPPLSLLLTTLSLLPSSIHFLYLAHTLPPGTNLTKFLPLLVGHGALSFFLFSFQVHEKGVLVPLLGVWMWMGEEAGGGSTDWGVFWNNVAVFRFVFVFLLVVF